jgi:hypothetical protein
MSTKTRIKMRAGTHLGEVLPFNPGPDDSVVKALMQVEELVMSGQVDGIAIAITARDGTPNNFYVKGSNRWTLLGSIQRLSSRIENDSEAS